MSTQKVVATVYYVVMGVQENLTTKELSIFLLMLMPHFMPSAMDSHNEGCFGVESGETGRGLESSEWKQARNTNVWFPWSPPGHYNIRTS